VADHLREARPGLVVELIEVRTEGDRDRTSPLTQIGGLGLFTREIQRALLDRRVDLAVHSLKDLPTVPVPGLTVAAVPVREDVADALIAPVFATLAALPEGARVGTGSQRRRAMVLHARPDLEVVAVRGNVETRLNKSLSGELDAVVLAFAGLSRLGLAGHVTERLGPPRFLPAVGQGALGLECRVDDEDTRDAVAALDDPATHRAVAAERSLLLALEAGCLLPVGAWGRVDGSGPADASLQLDACVFEPEGRAVLMESAAGPMSAPEDLGRLVASRLLDRGAGDLLRRPKGEG
jgi:hydroxymethylbilane synthase